MKQLEFGMQNPQSLCKIFDNFTFRTDEVGIFYTKKTPVYKVHFSKRNLLYGLGNFRSNV